MILFNKQSILNSLGATKSETAAPPPWHVKIHAWRLENSLS